jgi:putative transposase
MKRLTALAGADREQVPVEAIGWLGARLILQQALEDEVSEFLGRGRYERSEETVSHRNGYEARTVKTTSGRSSWSVPGCATRPPELGFESRPLGRHVTHTYALESLVISSFLRGLSTRDVEAVLEDTFDQPVSSRSPVSRILEDTRELYRRWCKRRLDEHDLVYLFWAIYLKLHPDETRAEGISVAWGVPWRPEKSCLGCSSVRARATRRGLHSGAT